MHVNLRWAIFIAAVLAISAFGFSLLEPATGDTVSANAVLSDIGGDISGYARATEPLDWQFPRDFGAHPEYQTEWWYYTGNLEGADGRRFGYQFTIFRRAISPETQTSSSEWRANQLYMAHFAVTDVAGEAFYHEQRFSRGGANLAGAQADPRYRVWLEDWQVIALDDSAETTRITASMADVSVDLTLTQIKPPALQGDMGLSAKSEEPGNASHYYSLTRLLTEGMITIGDVVHSVSGASWKDHEFSTSALGSTALGWDWFGLQFDDQREMMVGQIRQVDGGRDPYFGGLLIQPDGSTRYLPADSFTIEATASWTSPHTGAEYPAGWVITVDIGEAEPLRLTVTPQIADQELTGGDIAYWEGTVRISGDVTGYGYAELTGYVDAMTGRF
ncbi:lipocalin-like domain-containing protein [Kamptonema cortianum]|nr:lipocalin-like domain-containing protein [Kamptonema cortianum]